MKHTLIYIVLAMTSNLVVAQTNSYPTTGNVKIFGVDEAWAEGISIVKPSGWSGIRFSRNNPSGGNYNGNWAIGYNNSNDFTISTNYNGTQYDGLFHISNSTRNVGIGTTTPSTKFSLGTSIQSRIVSLYDDPSDWYGLGIQSYQMRLQVGTSNARFSFYAGDNAEIMTIKGSGNIGIGSPSPSTKLDIVGSGSVNVDLKVTGRIQSGDGANAGGMHVGTTGMFMGQVNANALGLWNNGAWRLMADNTGNIGIGTLSPTQKLTVNGTIYGKEVKVDVGAGAPDYVFEKRLQAPIT